MVLVILPDEEGAVSDGEGRDKRDIFLRVGRAERTSVLLQKRRPYVQHVDFC